MVTSPNPNLDNSLAKLGLPPQIREEVERQINFAFELGQKLYNAENIERNTKVVFNEVGIINAIQSLGERQDAFRKLFWNNDNKCVTTRLVEHNLALRSSIDGWRSEQTVQILQSPQVSQSQQPQMPLDIGKGSIKGRM